MLVAAFVFLASGVLLRIRNGDTNWISFLLLGLTLGFGYLTKQVMFPLAFVFLAVGMLAVGNLRRAVRHVSIALITFLSMSAPLIIGLYVAKGRLTYGDSGPFAYAVTVNNVAFRHWQGEELGSGTPAHPTRKIFDKPATFEFGSPIGGTYPLWYDITYWYEGVKTRFDVVQQAKVILSNLNVLQELLLGLTGSLITGLIVMLVASSRGWSLVKDISEFWFLLLPAVSALCLYSLVLVEGRYVAPFLPILMLSIFFGARLREFQRTGKIATAVTVVITFMLMIRFIPGIFSSVADLRNWRDPRLHPYWEVASELSKMGLRAGDTVASVSYANVNNVKWARLARVRIIAEVYHSIYDPEKNDFWKAEPSVQKQVIRAFANLGVRVIVSDEEPRGPGTDGWQRIGDTSYFVYFLPTQSFSHRRKIESS
jgi:4-amino-4-deoxy-L-arabinose transferase-like glycosyltransferase